MFISICLLTCRSNLLQLSELAHNMMIHVFTLQELSATRGIHLSVQVLCDSRCHVGHVGDYPTMHLY